MLASGVWLALCGGDPFKWGDEQRASREKNETLFFANACVYVVGWCISACCVSRGLNLQIPWAAPPWVPSPHGSPLTSTIGSPPSRSLTQSSRCTASSAVRSLQDLYLWVEDALHNDHAWGGGTWDGGEVLTLIVCTLAGTGTRAVT